jgi:GNAT superfamily N-acetyltransferase
MTAISPIVNSIIYREIHPSETAAVSSLAREVFDQFVAPHYQTEGVAEFHRYASVEALSQRHNSGHITLVAEHSGELAGMLHLREPRHVSMLVVRSSLQRRGIAGGLLASAGNANCEFSVNSSPNAVAAYERLGFRITGSEQCVHGSWRQSFVCRECWAVISLASPLRLKAPRPCRASLSHRSRLG